MLIAELARRNAWQQWGVLSCAHWLDWKCGIDMGAAREKVRVARALENLPLVSEALARGELSYSKARAITRVATPESQDYLLMIARHGTASHVEKLVRAYRRVERLHEAARARSTHAQRALRWGFEDDGSMTDHRAPARRAGRAGAAGDSRGGRCAVARARRRRSGVDAQRRAQCTATFPRKRRTRSRRPPTASTTPNRPWPRAAPMRCAISPSSSSRTRP